MPARTTVGIDNLCSKGIEPQRATFTQKLEISRIGLECVHLFIERTAPACAFRRPERMLLAR